MTRFKGRFKRWKKIISRAKWKDHKKKLLENGWVEVGENILAPPGDTEGYPPYIPTHLGGKREKGKNVKLYKNMPGLPRRSEMRKIRQVAKAMGYTARQFMSGDWHNS